jgi:hypothetical protein
MRDAQPLTPEEVDRPILPWRLVAGAFLHFVVPVYLIAIVLDFALIAPPVAGVEPALHRVLHISPALLGGYAGFALLATLGAALADPMLRARRARRRAAHPHAAGLASERRLRGALTQGKGLFGPATDRMLAGLGAARWDHGDPHCQALARDLAEAVAASADALATAPAERRAGIVGMAAATIGRIAAAQEQLAAIRAREDERQAQIVAGYVEARYGSDFSGGAS